MDVVRVVFDVFPATVRTPDAVYRDARAALTEEGEFTVWSATSGRPDAGPGPVYQVVQDSAMAHEGTADRRVVVQLASGAATVEPQGGCGCGNPLRSFDPWPNQRRLKVG